MSEEPFSRVSSLISSLLSGRMVSPYGNLWREVSVRTLPWTIGTWNVFSTPADVCRSLSTVLLICKSSHQIAVFSVPCSASYIKVYSIRNWTSRAGRLIMLSLECFCVAQFSWQYAKYRRRINRSIHSFLTHRIIWNRYFLCVKHFLP